MEMGWETTIFERGQNIRIGSAKVNSIVPRYSRSGLRTLQAIFSLDVPVFAQPALPTERIPQAQKLQLMVSNFAYGVKCDVMVDSGQVVLLTALGGPFNGVARLSGEVKLETLQYIENVRRGTNVTFNLDFNMLIEQRTWWALMQGDQVTKTFPWVSHQTLLHAGWDNIKIAASDWEQEFLPGFRYDSPFYLELPRLPSNLLYGSAKKHMEDAFGALKAGGASYRAVPAYCLNALDALSKTLGYKNLGEIPELLTQSITSVERRAVIQKFKAYINRWRHDQTGKGSTTESLPEIEYEEAMFIYVAASYLIQLIAKLTPRNDEP